MKCRRVVRWILAILLICGTILPHCIQEVKAADTKLSAYAAYYDLIMEEIDNIGKPIIDQDYYKMFTDKTKNARVNKILAAHLIDVTNDGIEELILKRYIVHDSEAMLDSDDCEWVCIYSYVDGRLKRIGQNHSWIKHEENNSWSYYEPDGYIGSILSFYEFPYISNECVYVCNAADGKVYLTDGMPDSVLDEIRTFYAFNGSVMAETASFRSDFIADWYDLGLGISSNYGRYDYYIGSTKTTHDNFYSTLNSYYSGGYTKLENNDYRTVLNKLESSLGSYAKPSSWAKEEVDKAMEAGYVPDHLQRNYTNPITREEFCDLAMQFFKTYTGRDILSREEFSDTSNTNVEKMGAVGVVNGIGEGKFAPKQLLTRQEAATILGRLADFIGFKLPDAEASFADNKKIASWAIGDVGRIAEGKVMTGVGDNKFDPLSSYTREQAILTILRLSKLTCDITHLGPPAC